MFAPALGSILAVDYVDIAPEAAEDPKHILLFFYYGGMIAAAIKVYNYIIN